jgi:hypothetical protein
VEATLEDLVERLLSAWHGSGRVRGSGQIHAEIEFLIDDLSRYCYRKKICGKGESDG